MPLDTSTVFAGASFSKTVFAWVVMQLVEEGLLDLDRPLHEYLARPLPSYPNYTDLEGDDRYRLDHATDVSESYDRVPQLALVHGR